jgi:hypothetical protein
MPKQKPAPPPALASWGRGAQRTYWSVRVIDGKARLCDRGQAAPTTSDVYSIAMDDLIEQAAKGTVVLG